MRLTLVLVVAWLGLVSAQLPQQEPAPSRPMFRSGVFVVSLDVSVLDKNREPVRWLTAADFTVLEDGRPQRVVAFSAVDVPDARVATPTSTWQRTVSSDVQSNAVARAPEGRLFVLLLDDALMPADQATIQNARKIARSVIDRLSPDDQLAVVFSLGSAGTQDFTNDRTKLLGAVETLQIGFAGYAMGWDTAAHVDQKLGGGTFLLIDGDAKLRLDSLRTLRDVANTLIAAPKRRKALILVTPGVPVDLDAAMPADIKANRQSGIPRTVRDTNAELSSELPALYQAMHRANISIYPIDPCGLGGINAIVREATQRTRALSSGTAPPSPMQDWYGLWTVPPRPLDVAGRVSQQDLEFMVATANNTGGRAIVNTNDFERGIAQIFHENASYYVLGYEAPNKNTPGSLHRLTVSVNRPGLTVRARSGYDMPGAEKLDPKRPASPTSKAVVGPIAAGDLPMEVVLAPVAVGGRAEAAVAVALGIRQPAVTIRAVQTFQLHASIFTPDGKPLREQHQTGQVTLKPVDVVAAQDSEKHLVRYELLTQIALKPGRYEIRFATHLDAGDITSSVYADVDVPDFAKAPLSLSGLMLEANPSLPGGPRNAFDGLLPVIPTSKREFAATDQVAAFLQVNQGGTTPLDRVALAIRVVNDHDVTVVDRQDSVAPEMFSASLRSANQRFALPLSALTPGEYLLTVTAKLRQTTVRRDVRFGVR